MYKRIWKDEEAVSPVIATILMVAITVVLAGVLVVYMQQFSQGPGTQAPTGSSVAQTFTNSVDQVAGKTKNMGGWYVQITGLQGSKPAFSDVTISLAKNGVPISKSSGIKAATATFSNTTGTNIRWYAFGAGGTLAYCTGTCITGAGAITNLASAANMGPGDFETLQNAYYAVLDSNANNVLDTGDQVYVYQNYAAGSTQQVGGPGWALTFSLGGSQICASNLG